MESLTLRDGRSWPQRIINTLEISQSIKSLSQRSDSLSEAWTVSLWREQKHSILHPALPFQHHPVCIHRDGAEGIAVRGGLDHPVYRHVVYARVFILTVPPVVAVSGHVTHHAAVGPDDGQQLLVVPGQADGVCGAGVHRDVTWTTKQGWISQRHFQTSSWCTQYLS